MKKVSLIICSLLILVSCGTKEENDNKGIYNTSEDKSNKGKNNTSEDKKLESNQEDSNSELNNDEVIIGSQVWMTKNLNVATFRNGDPIPEAKTIEEWLEARDNEQPAWCYYENDPANGAKYGKLYNWYAVNDPRGLAPEGYHVPTDDEWTKLTDFLGEGAATKMKSKSGWKVNGNSTNSSRFSGLPGGYRNYNLGTFYSIGLAGYLWSSTDSFANSAWNLSLTLFEGDVSRFNFDKGEGLSVRCLRD